MGIKGDGGNSHAASHDGYLDTVVDPGVSEHSADIIEQDRVLKIGFRHIFCAERIAWHQDYFCNMCSVFYFHACRW